MAPLAADETARRGPQRAPSLQLSARPAAAEGDQPFRFRLPCPPVPTVGVYAAHAVERRAKKMYFAVLDAMRTGVVDPLLRARLARLIADARPRADDMLRHLMRVLDAVARHARETGGRPLIPPPPAPLADVTVEFSALTPGVAGRIAGDAVAEVLRWPVEWLQTRGLTVGKATLIDCRLPGRR